MKRSNRMCSQHASLDRWRRVDYTARLLVHVVSPVVTTVAPDGTRLRYLGLDERWESCSI